MNKILKQSIDEEFQKAKEQEYAQMVDENKPPQPVLKDCCFAFLVGGIICAIGQIIYILLERLGIVADDAALITLIILIFLGVLLTIFGIYSKIGKIAGAGSIIPITGFANSIASPAIEWQREGYIYGVAAKIFTVAGPVIVFGISSSIALALIKYMYLWFIGGI